jgi:hypothetical protein
VLVVRRHRGPGLSRDVVVASVGAFPLGLLRAVMVQLENIAVVWNTTTQIKAPQQWLKICIVMYILPERWGNYIPDPTPFV